MQRIELGLVTYLAETEPERLEVSHVGDEAEGDDRPSRREDRWDRRVFETDVSGSFRGQDIQTFHSVDGNVAANRTIREWKIGRGYTFGSIYSGVVNPRFENLRDGS